MSRGREAFVVLELDGGERELRFQRSLAIGRDPENDLVLAGEGVSRYHALLRAQAGACVLVDLGSSNGCFVNGRLMAGATTLTPGDEIEIGDERMRFVRGEVPDIAADRRATVRELQTVRSFTAREACLLVSDIRGFTRLSEEVPDERLPRLVADWFRIVGDLVQERGGTVEEFRGDSVMAFWLAASGSGPAAAVASALETAAAIVRRAAAYGAGLGGVLGGEGFRVGCGVHSGLAYQGNIGSESHRDITMLGDSVNVTYRIEALCGPLERPVLVSPAARAAAGDAFRFEALGRQELKGKDEPLEVFALEI